METLDDAKKSLDTLSGQISTLEPWRWVFLPSALLQD
jgi:hypothetical protein